MTRGGRALPGDARRLVDENVRSVGVLDLLMLICRESERWWTPDEISEPLRCPVGWAAVELEDLHAAGLLESDGHAGRRYRYRPRSPRLAKAVDDLMAAYAADPRQVVRLIFTAAG
jgi:DNA-binding IclR family transcriptional regulator